VKSFTVRDLRERYGVSEPTILGWIHSGELRAVNVGGSARTKKPRWRITQAALDAFEQSRTTTPIPPRERRQKPAGDVIQFIV